MLSLLAPSRPTRAAPAVVNPTLFNNGAGLNALGVTDRDAPTEEQQRTAYRGLIATCARIRANAVAEAMLGATVERQTSGTEYVQVEDAHPWVALLRAPHPTWSPRFTWSWAQQAKDLGRGAFFYVERDARGVPLYLHPIFPAFGEVRPIGGESGEIVGYAFRRSDGAPTRWAARDVLWLRHPHPVSPYESASLLEISAYESDSDLYNHVYRRDVMKRGGLPKIQLTTDQKLSDLSQRELSDKATAMFYGNVPRVPVFGEGTEAKPLGLTSEDLDFIEGARLTRTEILQMWLGAEGLLSDHANRANADAARYTFADLIVQPEADANCDQLTAQLRSAYAPERPTAEDRARISVLVVRAPDVVPLDPDYALRQQEMQVRAGLRSINELREPDGFKPVKGGEEPMVSLALVPLSRASEPPPKPPPAAPPPVAPEEPEPDEPVAGRSYRADDDARTRAWRAADAGKVRAEGPIRTAAARVLSRMGEEAVRRLRETARGARDKGAPDAGVSVSVDALFDVERWVEEVASELGGSIAAALREGFAHGLTLTGADLAFDPASPGARRALALNVDRVRSVPTTARGHLEVALRDGMAAGEDVDGLARRVRALFDELADWQAERIARTASHASFEGGALHSYAEADVGEKEWVSERDARVRPAHVSLDGERVALDAAFSNGEEYPSAPNCRCTTLPILSDEPRAGASTWARRRNAHIRAEYVRRRAAGEERPDLIDALGAGSFEGRPYALAYDTARKACDGLTP